MFDLDRLIADCRDAVAEDSSHKAVREIAGARRALDPAASSPPGSASRGVPGSSRSIAPKP